MCGLGCTGCVLLGACGVDCMGFAQVAPVGVHMLSLVAHGGMCVQGSEGGGRGGGGGEG